MFFQQCIVPDCGGLDFCLANCHSPLLISIGGIYFPASLILLDHMTCFGQKDVRACDTSGNLKCTCTVDFGLLHTCLSP